MSTYIPRAGDRVRVRRYEQPRLRSGDPDRVLTHEWTGTVDRHDGVVTDGGDLVSFAYTFVSDGPVPGTRAYFVTEVEPLT